MSKRCANPSRAPDPGQVQGCKGRFDRELQAFALDGWILSRTQRPRRALTRAVT